MRQMMLRRRRIQQFGHLDRGSVLQCDWLATPGFGPSLCTSKSRMNTEVNAYDDSLLWDKPEYTFLEPVLKRLRARGETLPLLNFDWTTVFTTAACTLLFERFGPPGLHQLLHGGASHEVFTAFRDVTGVQEGSRWGSFSGPRRSIAPDACTSRTSMLRGLSPKVGSPTVGALRNGDRKIRLLLCSGAALVARQWKCTRSRSTLTCLALGSQSQVFQALAQTALQLHVTGLSCSLRVGRHRRTEFLERASTAGCLGSLPVGWSFRLRVPVIIELTISQRTCASTNLGTGSTVKTCS